MTRSIWWEILCLTGSSSWLVALAIACRIIRRRPEDAPCQP
ncbi:MAG: hypothetical protein Q9P01_16990 [Anaerolineae bacterium]|nr:hypothetical protein [Anaerolineae bacterium]